MSRYKALLFLTVSGVLATRASCDWPLAAGVKRQQCLHGDYNHEGNTCCSCPPGEYVEKHCTQSNSTKCLKCDPGYYNTYNNSLDGCTPCRSCNDKVHLEVATDCTSTQNRECKCMEGHYCAERECRSCIPCNKCDGYKIVKACTKTSDAVCQDQSTTNHSTIIAVTVSSILIVLLLILIFGYCWWNKKQSRSFAPQHQPQADQQDELDPLLRDIDLSPFLYTIVEEVGHKTVKELAIRSGIAQAKIDMHIDSYPNNIREQCYYILKEWYERQGLKNACSVLITELKEMGHRASADKLVQKFYEHINKNESA